MQIREAKTSDLQAITSIETICFPPKEAASKQTLQERLKAYPQHFWLLEDAGKVIGFINGLVTNQPDLADVMYEKASLHQENGQWQMIFGLDVLPAYRRQGCAKLLLKQVVVASKKQKRRGLVLTCKANLVPYYAKFGFADEGIAASTHGDVVWHQMRLRLKPINDKK